MNSKRRKWRSRSTSISVGSHLGLVV